jgi:hypothetical protein
MKQFYNLLLAAWLGFWGGIIVMLLAFVVALSGCAASHEAAPDVLPASSVQLRPDSLAPLPPYLVPAPAGSTPRQRRQWQKAQTQNLALAGILPTKIKNSSVASAPGATAINRPASAVATAAGSTATDARKAGQRGGALAVGPGATATATSSGPPWWVYALVAVLGAAGWELATHRLAPARWLPWRARAA